MNKMKIEYLYQFKKAHPDEDWRAFFKYISVKKTDITKYYQRQLNETYDLLEQKLFDFTKKQILKGEGATMSNIKAKFYIKTAVDLYNKYAQ